MTDPNSPRTLFHVDPAPARVFPTPLPPIADLPLQPGQFVCKADWPIGIPYGYQPTAHTFDSAFKAAMDDPDVSKLLRRKRYAAVAAELLNTPCTDPCAPLVVKLIIYNYTDDRVLEVHVDLTTLGVVRTDERSYQPPLGSREVDRASQIAREANELTGRLSKDLEATAILTSLPDGSTHRGVLVFFAPSEARSATLWVLVDLSAETVVEVVSAEQLEER